MEAPDKITNAGAEYLRKDALIKWAKKELEGAELTDFDEYGRGEVITWMRVLDELNSM